jgi:hypothetical protein
VPGKYLGQYRGYLLAGKLYIKKIYSAIYFSNKSEKLSLTIFAPSPFPSPHWACPPARPGEREGVRGNFKYLWLEFMLDKSRKEDMDCGRVVVD